MSKPAKESLLQLILTIYDTGPSESAWLSAMSAAAHGSLEADALEMAYTFETRDGDYPLLREVGGPPGAFDLSTLDALVRAFPPEVSARAFSRPMVSTLSELFGAAAVENIASPHLLPHGGVDPLGVVAVDSSGNGVVLTGSFRAVTRLSPAIRRRWMHITAHLASGLRLRRGVDPAGGRSASELPQHEAVLDLGGRLHHASGAAETREHRVALRQAARAIDRAKSRRSSVDEAVEGWRALVSGRWSLVEQFESDGRHYLIARPNPPRPRAAPALSPAERAVVALAALGRANKLIAYELGLAVGTVGTLLLRASKKLGVRSRTALIAAWNRKPAA